MLISKGKGGVLHSSLQKTTSFHFSKKTFMDEEGRKIIHVKNPIYQHPSIKTNENTGDDKEKTKTKKRGIRRFFGNASSPI